MIAANREAKKVQALLDDDSDTYLKNDCRADKWFILELAQVAKVNRFELSQVRLGGALPRSHGSAHTTLEELRVFELCSDCILVPSGVNARRLKRWRLTPSCRAPQFELYSSRVKEFEVRGRQSHPRTDGVEYSRGLDSPAWKLLGNYTAEKTKGTQSFGIDPAAWVRYMLLRFVSHHGSEPVCALNAFSVFGELGSGHRPSNPSMSCGSAKGRKARGHSLTEVGRFPAHRQERRRGAGGSARLRGSSGLLGSPGDAGGARSLPAASRQRQQAG